MSNDQIRLVVTRRLAASPERVFDAWLDEANIGRWLFATPDGVMEHVKVDPRVGGGFEIDERRGDQLARHWGRYLVLDRPSRIVFEFGDHFSAEPTRVAVEIAPDGSGCIVTLTHELDPKWASVVDSARKGWTGILDGLSRAVT
jgi:uncharacterized protein YndB with AHSA1/START domain